MNLGVSRTKKLSTIPISPAPSLRRACVILVVLSFRCVAICQPAQAVSPPPDGAYPNANTAEGNNALFNLDVTTGQGNTAVGNQALFTTKTGRFNTAVGNSALEANTSGAGNTATGGDALLFNTTGDDNTATGIDALFENKTGNENTATGAGALDFNVSGSQNTATGADALFHNVSGTRNTASGFQALYQNNGNSNTASGYQALHSNTTGGGNTATGQGAMFTNSNGFGNTATGNGALYSNTSGDSNTGMGASALFNNQGDKNTATGVLALYSNVSGTNNTADGYRALLNTTGDNNVAIGSAAGTNLTTGSNNIDIDAAGVSDESGKIRIGTKGTHNGTFIAGISGVAVTGSTVVVNSNGKLGIATSSARFKEAIKPIGTASEAILALKPVTFRYKEEVDPDKIPQFGLVAEEVEKVDPKLVIHDEQGKPFTVHYEAVNAMLLNEFLKEHRKVQQLEANALEQQKQIEALTTAVQRMSIQLERDKTNLSVSGPSLAGHPSDPTLEPRLMKGQ